MLDKKNILNIENEKDNRGQNITSNSIVNNLDDNNTNNNLILSDNKRNRNADGGSEINNSFNSENFDKINNKFANENIKSEVIKHYHSIEDIIDCGSFNLKTFNIIILCSLFIFLEGFYLAHFNIILIPFKKYYNISDLSVSTISSLSFLGMGIGCSTVGFLSKRFCRIKIIYISIICIFFFHLILSLVQNVYSFAAARFLIMIFLGFYMVLILNILTEYLPIKFRGFILNFIWINWQFGSIFFLYICKIFIPNLDYNPSKPFDEQNFHKAIFQLIYVIFFIFIINYFLLEDSPRNLILKGKHKEGKKILEYYTRQEFSIERIKLLEKNLINSGENSFYNEREVDITMIFHKRIKFLSIIMIFIYFFLSMGYYGIIASAPFIFKGLETKQIDQNNEKIDIINEMILIYALTIIGCFVGGITSEIKKLGRKYSEIIGFIFAFIFGLISVIHNKYFSFWIGISISFFGAVFNLHISYTEEIYPTKIRDFAVGILLGISRLGAFISQYTRLYFDNISLFFSVYSYLGMIVILIILIFLLPKDNTGQIDSYIILTEGENSSKNEEIVSEKHHNDEEDKNLIVKDD